MTIAQVRAKKVAKTKRLPKQLQARERLLDAVDLVGRLNAVASNRKALVHNHNLGIERDRLATHAKGPALEGLNVIGESLRRNEQRFASDFASAVRGTPRGAPMGMTPRPGAPVGMTPMGMTPMPRGMTPGNMTRPPMTPGLPTLVPPTPAGPPPPGPAPVPTPRRRRRRSEPPTPNPARDAAIAALQLSRSGRDFLGFARAAGV